MLTDLVKGRTAAEVAALPKEEILDEVGIPLTPGPDEVRDPRARGGQGRAQPLEGDAAPRRMAGPRHWLICTSPRSTELPPGSMKLVEHEPFRVGVYNCDGELHAIEDRCSHDDGPLCLGNWDEETCTRRLPASRRQLRPRERAGALAARLPAGADLPGPRRGRRRHRRDRRLRWPSRFAAGRRPTPSTSATTTRNGAGRSATSAGSTSGSASRGSSRGSRG